MNTDISPDIDVKNVSIKKIETAHADNFDHAMKQFIPKWSPENNRIVFAAYHDDVSIGMIAISFETTYNAHIDYMVISHLDLQDTVGRKLLMTAENYSLENGFTSITVETLSPKQNDSNANLSIYHFYEKSGYKPLIQFPGAQDFLAVLLHKTISLNDFTFIDMTHTLSPEVPHWGIDAGFKYNARNIQTAETKSGLKFRVQRLEMTAGIGTHMDAPSHCFEEAPSINEIPIESLITICRVIDVSDKAHDHYTVSPEDILNFEEKYGRIPTSAFVIIYTGWDQRWSEPDKYRNEKIFPNISIEAAKLLLSRNITGIGIDTLSPDAFGSDFPVHALILGAGKFIIENVANAKLLDPGDGYVIALPMKIFAGTEAPMRLVGLKRKHIMY